MSLTDRDVVEVSCGRGAGAVWCVRTHTPRSFIGMDSSQNVIDLCQRLHSNVPQLSFVVANAPNQLPFPDQSTDVVICIETTHRFGGRIPVARFASEVARVLRPNGYFLWCDFCRIDGSDTSLDYLTANDELVVEEKMNITQNVLHALDIQSNSRADFAERFVRSGDQDYFRLFAGLPGTHIYEDMRQGRSEYWRAVLRKKIIATMPEQ